MVDKSIEVSLADLILVLEGWGIDYPTEESHEAFKRLLAQAEQHL